MVPHLSATLVVCADGRPAAGLGHVRRMLALAQTWRDAGGRVQFVTHAAATRFVTPTDERLQVVSVAGLDVETLIETAAAQALATSAAWIALDGYAFGESCQRKLQSTGSSLLVVDDLAQLTQYHADAILNGNAGAESFIYRSGRATRILAGDLVRLVSPALAPLRKPRRAAPSVAERLLISLGATPQPELMRTLLTALDWVDDVELEVRIIGGTTYDELSSTAALVSIHRLEPLPLLAHLDAHFQWADVAISAGGQTLAELLYLGVPCLAVVVADNQRTGVEHWSRAGLIEAVPATEQTDAPAWAKHIKRLLHDPAQRDQLSARSQARLDGQGNQRVVQALADRGLVLEAATPEHAELLFAWVNDPATRSASFADGPIDADTHRAWFAERLADPQGRMYVAHDVHGAALGCLRFQVEPRELHSAVVSINIAPEARQRGWGRRLITLGARRYWRDEHSGQVTRLLARIKPSNLASIEAFEFCGFQCLNDEPYHDQPCLTYELRRDA